LVAGGCHLSSGGDEWVQAAAPASAEAPSPGAECRTSVVRGMEQGWVLGLSLASQHARTEDVNVPSGISRPRLQSVHDA
jgi:hypothetical protein